MTRSKTRSAGGSGRDRLASFARSGRAADLLIPGSLAVGALLVRLPDLWAIPSLTDEANEILRGFEIAQGRLVPATNVASYLSPAFNYLLAALFWLVGPSPYLPRLVALLAGVLTVPSAYLLARDLADVGRAGAETPRAGIGRLAGAIASALLAANGAHALVNSHVAWSHATTPLWVTLGLWLLHRAVSRDDGRTLAGAALAFGVAIQSHTTALALLPGALAYSLWRRPRWLGDRRAWLAALLFLAVTANLPAYALGSGGESVARARGAMDAYARGAPPSWDLYVANLGRLGVGLLRVLAGAVDVREDAAAYLRDPLVWSAAGMTAAGAFLALRRGDPLVVCVVLPYALLFAHFNAKYQVVPNARYLTPLLPLFLAVMSLAFAAWIGSARSRPAAVIATTLALLLVVGALRSFQVRSAQLAPSREASLAVVGAVAAVEAQRPPDEPVALDPDLEKLWLDGGGDYHMALRYHLTLGGIPVSDLETRPNRQQGAVDTCRPGRVELRHVRPDLTPRAPRLLADDPATPADESLHPYWLIRTVQPRDRARDAERGQAEEWSAMIAAYRPPVDASARAVDRCAPGLPI